MNKTDTKALYKSYKYTVYVNERGTKFIRVKGVYTRVSSLKRGGIVLLPK